MTQEQEVRDALEKGGVADITTTGRKTGLPRRIEIYFHNIDDDLILTGRPVGKRDWEANIKAEPRFTLHLTKGPIADVEVVGEVVSDPDERTRLIRKALVESWGHPPEKADQDLPVWVDISPLVRFRLV